MNLLTLVVLLIEAVIYQFFFVIGAAFVFRPLIWLMTGMEIPVSDAGVLVDATTQLLVLAITGLAAALLPHVFARLCDRLS